MNKPKAVLISDIHYNIQTLEVADKALRMAVNKANELAIPLIIAGDLHDTKANIRGECITAIMNTLKGCKFTPIIMIGNHDKINEKSNAHALDFLGEGFNRVIDKPEVYIGLYFIPYQHDITYLKQVLHDTPKGSTLIMHQGVQDTEAGHYFMDRSSILKQDLASFRVISGHYHTRQSFALPDGGRFDYLGNPFTLGFGEANDPQKGFQVLYDDGSLEFIPTNLRRHVVREFELNKPCVYPENYPPKVQDLVWVKIKGSSEDLVKFTKDKVKSLLGLEYLTQDFRLDLIPTDTKTSKQPESQNLPQTQILDNLIDSLTNTDDNRKARLKELWKQLK